jgi:hypothetical protein
MRIKLVFITKLSQWYNYFHGYIISRFFPNANTAPPHQSSQQFNRFFFYHFNSIHPVFIIRSIEQMTHTFELDRS